MEVEIARDRNRRFFRPGRDILVVELDKRGRVVVEHPGTVSRVTKGAIFVVDKNGSERKFDLLTARCCGYSREHNAVELRVAPARPTPRAVNHPCLHRASR